MYGTKHSRMNQKKVFKGCFLQILLRPFLKILSHIKPLNRDDRRLINKTMGTTFFAKMIKTDFARKRNEDITDDV